MRKCLRKRFLFAFLLMGFSFTIIQGLMIRELLVSFYGNELSIGLILGNWLVLEAVGSGLIGRLAARYRAGPTSYALLQIVLAVMLPLSLYGAFTVRNAVGVTAGQGVSLGGIFSSSLLILAPLGLVDGAMFAFGAHAFAQLMGREVPGIGQVYVYEAAGGIIGGLIFTYLLIPYLSSLQMALRYPLGVSTGWVNSAMEVGHPRSIVARHSAERSRSSICPGNRACRAGP